jgi:hypothetical protein
MPDASLIELIYLWKPIIIKMSVFHTLIYLAHVKELFSTDAASSQTPRFFFILRRLCVIGKR